MHFLRAFVLALASASSTVNAAQPVSTCYGTPAHGRLEHGVALPASGPNFSAYATAPEVAGRNFLHATTREIVLAAYAAVARHRPEARFVYGETGFEQGGEFKPHRTHQNGGSIDFMVPVTNAAKRAVPLPTPARLRYGYDIEFDGNARYGEYAIDFDTLAEHLYQLDLAARAHGVRIAKVIFEPQYLPRLFATPRGAYLKRSLPFVKSRVWWRHDEHYHVDFALDCAPLSALNAPRAKR